MCSVHAVDAAAPSKLMYRATSDSLRCFYLFVSMQWLRFGCAPHRDEQLSAVDGASTHTPLSRRYRSGYCERERERRSEKVHIININVIKFAHEIEIHTKLNRKQPIKIEMDSAIIASES